MNNTMSPENKIQKITLGLVMGWALGIIFIVLGIAGFANQPITAIALLISSLFALPIATKFMSEKMHISLSVGVRVLIVIILFTVGVAVSSSGNKSSVTSQTVSVPAPDESKPSTPVTRSAPVVAPVAVPQVLLNISGSGTKSTETFSPAGDWTLSYTYNCSNFGTQGNFQVFIYNSDGSMNDFAGPNELGSSGSDTEYYHSGGSYYLEVNSECSWTVKVKG